MRTTLWVHLHDKMNVNTNMHIVALIGTRVAATENQMKSRYMSMLNGYICTIRPRTNTMPAIATVVLPDSTILSLQPIHV